ncbi:MAG: hypothetical protein MI757_17580 [Pirellulales bacterium]|nr:hypothetical protein [Pirellulales bacterium]
MTRMRITCLFLLAIATLAARPATGQTIGDLLGDGRARWVQFQIVDGRIRAQSPYYGRFRSYSGNDKKQRLTIGANMSGVGVIRYSWSGEKDDVVAEATESGEIKITQAPKDDSDATYRDFLQPTRGPVVVPIGLADERQEVAAPSIWHLWLKHPEACDKHLAPLLAVLRDGWNWKPQVANLKIEMMRLAKASNLPDQARWAELVTELASSKFVERQRAERLLRGYGRAAVPYLQGLDRKKLDAEQQFRIKRIVLASYGASDDTPGRVATWLVGDVRAWVPLLASDDAGLRKLAAQQLKQLSKQPLDFDPAADADTRRKQIERIRRQLTD